MAKFEEAASCHSTWFFLFDCPVYNIFSVEVMDIISKLVTNGHNVGLHVDAMRYSTFDKMKESLDGCLAFFDQMACSCGYQKGMISKVLSFHRPASWLLEKDIGIEGWLNAYKDDFFGMNEKVVYVSDSNRREFWNEDRLMDGIKTGRNITLLTHPAWWHNAPLSDDETFDYIISSVGTTRIRHLICSTAKRYADRMQEVVARC